MDRRQFLTLAAATVVGAAVAASAAPKPGHRRARSR
nr:MULTISPECIES: twin-arginine translocation signal domain-containing protein [Rhodococcus]